MLTKTIGQLSAATSIADADLFEIEQSGISKYGSVALLVEGVVATTAESLLGTSNSVLMTPIQVREAVNANNSAPIYACRAWVKFDGTTTSSSISATYTRASGSTTVVVTATAHGCITGNVQYLDFTSGTASDNSYIVTYVDDDTFNVTTIASTLTSGNVTIKRSPMSASGNVNNVSYNVATAGTYFINYAVEMPNADYSMAGMAHGSGASVGRMVDIDNAVAPTEQSTKVFVLTDAGTLAESITSIQVVC